MQDRLTIISSVSPHVHVLATQPNSMSDSTRVESQPGRTRCAVASTSLPAGTALTQFSGEPYAACLLRPQWPQRCAHCFRPAEGERQLLRCSRCRHARYCNAACQAADWKWHKHECPSLPGLDRVAAAAVADLLLAARCLRRKHVEPTSPATESFDQMVRGEPREGDAELGQLAASMTGLLPPGTTASDVASLFATFRCNNFGVLDPLLAVVGAACHPAAALLNHSCAPNCVLAYRGKTLEIRTLRAVAADEELCHSYTELCQPTAVRQQLIRDSYGFACRCSRCEDGLVYEESPDDSMPVDDVMEGAKDDRSASGDVERARALLRQAEPEEDLAKEAELVFEALELLRGACHHGSLVRYGAEGQALGVALAGGDLERARECCVNAVRFLEMALSHCPRHPLLALQRFTLADLHEACGDTLGAATTMAACAEALKVTHGRGDELAERAIARLAELSATAYGFSVSL